MVTIEIYADPICPWCFIGKKRLEAALALRPDVKTEIRWRTFQLNPDMPNDGMERQSYLSAKFGGAGRANEIYSHIRKVGEQVGIPFAFDRIHRTPNTMKAHRLIRYAQTQEDASGPTGMTDRLVESLYTSYFLNGADIGSDDILLDLAEDVGLDRTAVQTYLDGRMNEAELQSEDMLARRLGIGGVPCFIVDGRYALSGAQEPEAFLPLLEMAMQEAAVE